MLAIFYANLRIAQLVKKSRPFMKPKCLCLDRELIRQMFTYTDVLYVSFKHVLISLTSFMGTPNSIRILYNTSLLSES
jgi:hypothetical protein